MNVTEIKKWRFWKLSGLDDVCEIILLCTSSVFDIILKCILPSAQFRRNMVEAMIGP